MNVIKEHAENGQKHLNTALGFPDFEYQNFFIYLA
jgi:hypothetical protein